MNTGLIILGGVVLVFIILLALYLYSRSKGKIRINLTNFNYSPGNDITGSVTLNLKKTVRAKALKVGLIGELKKTSPRVTRTGGHSQSSTSQTIFDFKQPLDGEKEYPPGEKTYDFSIKIPQNILSQPNLGEGVLGSLIKSAQILSGNFTNIRWYIVSSLEMPGFDISKRVQINIA